MDFKDAPAFGGYAYSPEPVFPSSVRDRERFDTMPEGFGRGRYAKDAGA